jgi:hypothetical protein
MKPNVKPLNETMPLMVLESQVSKAPGVLRTLRGIFSVADYVNKEDNRNNRLYSEKLLREKIIDSPYTKEMLKRGVLLGEADHPEDRLDVSIKEVSHKITELTLKDGVVCGTIQILDTPVGNIVETLLKTGSKIGISSRGAGSTKKENGKDRVLEEDYLFYTYDLVLNPGFGSAILEGNGRGFSNPRSGRVLKAIKETVSSMDDTALPIVQRVLENANREYFGDVIKMIEERVTEKSETTSPRRFAVRRDSDVRGLLKLREANTSLRTENERLAGALRASKLQVNELRGKYDALRDASKGTIEQTEGLQKTVTEANVRAQELEREVRDLRAKLKGQRQVELESRKRDLEGITREAEKEVLQARQLVRESASQGQVYRAILVSELRKKTGVDAQIVESLLPRSFTESDYNAIAHKLTTLKAPRRVAPVVEKRTVVTGNKIEDRAEISEKTERLSRLVKNLA